MHAYMHATHNIFARFITYTKTEREYCMLYRAVGGGISSTSKVCIIEKSARPGHDVDYTFGQVDMRSGAVDWSGETVRVCLRWNACRYHDFYLVSMAPQANRRHCFLEALRQLREDWGMFNDLKYYRGHHPI